MLREIDALSDVCHPNAYPDYASYRDHYCDLREMHRAQLRREITDHIEALRTEAAIKAEFDAILFPYGLRVVRRPGRVFGDMRHMQ